MQRSSLQSNWVLMTKGGEQKLVHPGNVGNHIRFGWSRVEDGDAEPEIVEEIEEETLTPAARETLTPNPRTSRPKKDK